MIVADASVIVLALLNDGGARRALTQGEAVAVPHLADAEIAHALRGQVRRGHVDAATAEALLRRWTHLGVRRFPVFGLLSRVWELRENLTAYDAAYVALAEALRVSLVTADARLARAPGPECPVTVVHR